MVEKNSYFISNDWNSFWSDVGQQTSGIVTWFGDQSKQMWAKFQEGWAVASQSGGNPWDWSKNAGADIGERFGSKGNEFETAFKQVWAIASQTGADLWSWIKLTGGSIGGWCGQKGRDFWNNLRNGWSALINSNPGALWTALTSALGVAWAVTRQWFVTKGQQMGSALSQGWTA